MENAKEKIDMKNYEYLEDPITGKTLAISKRTGEVFDTEEIIIPVDRTTIYTGEQQEHKKRRVPSRIDRNTPGNENAKFYFASLSVNFPGVSMANIVRLMYIASYLKYGTDQLYKTERSPMKKDDLKAVLNTSESTTRRFLTEVVDYINVDDDNHLHLLQPVFIYGEMSKNGGSYQKIFTDRIKTLYKNTRPSWYKYLGYVFALLPYISVEYNALCFNPNEKDLDKVHFMSLREFSAVYGLSESHIARVRRALSRIYFTVNDHYEPFCSFVVTGNSLDQVLLYVNPHVIYSGSNYEKVLILGAFSANARKTLAS